ncbi:hypothetical protein bthur0007_62180 [Bacillus thuringiensis serovar monterrey BGSC 4AJ1]|nr:hypothetical protein bthur0007_62180 [Bacillus thuringiensis serovar monterrey BGSC 4AJ1]EEM91089.1 hypothetical protein bthur0012_8950 [Bacillus thuringiensis serovar pulsiensis BGSC 4CC1]
MQKIPFLITYKWGTAMIGMYKEMNKIIEKETTSTTIEVVFS